ncbi:MAG: hypothetical protein GC150_14500 [Rhizobiales bacterium]|nr:hypothetical protein [Hyphomicrobiales bacterium]
MHDIAALLEMVIKVEPRDPQVNVPLACTKAPAERSGQSPNLPDAPKRIDIPSINEINFHAVVNIGQLTVR